MYKIHSLLECLYKEFAATFNETDVQATFHADERFVGNTVLEKEYGNLQKECLFTTGSKVHAMDMPTFLSRTHVGDEDEQDGLGTRTRSHTGARINFPVGSKVEVLDPHTGMWWNATVRNVLLLEDKHLYDVQFCDSGEHSYGFQSKTERKHIRHLQIPESNGDASHDATETLQLALPEEMGECPGTEGNPTTEPEPEPELEPQFAGPPLSLTEVDVSHMLSSMSLNEEKPVPTDLLIAADRVLPLWLLFLLAGVKNAPVQDQIRATASSTAHDVMKTDWTWFHEAVCGTQGSSTLFAYCTGVTYFCKRQLVLYSHLVKMTAAPATRLEFSIPFENAPIVFMSFIENVERQWLLAHGRDLDVRDVKDGRSYVTASTRLITIQYGLFSRCGPYTSARIARAILHAFGYVEDWGDVTIEELAAVSPDKCGFFDNFPKHMLVSELAKHVRHVEYMSMWYCLSLQECM